ncbi:hypothetical protein AX774_g7839 [Zancudomyces culisetae]|uniref:Uncharacterized protein n=1 Tax=Zancudomyces culisetae TaxID=1213189 RepID=A0A1R1PCV4_ZANCU|nr:hypothetical protein AX774_g7839 [Zancudomyces culisetae]|eukprot:OMH78763.1 hypothetical protein AX774_g7839 [Zancudomyces culisetae]
MYSITVPISDMDPENNIPCTDESKYAQFATGIHIKFGHNSKPVIQQLISYPNDCGKNTSQNSNIFGFFYNLSYDQSIFSYSSVMFIMTL